MDDKINELFEIREYAKKIWEERHWGMSYDYYLGHCILFEMDKNFERMTE